MAAYISSAEPEKLFRYSDFGTQLDGELVSEAVRLTATLQHFEFVCTEPGFRMNVVQLGEALHDYGTYSESVDLWVRLVGKGFQMADWIGYTEKPPIYSTAYADWQLTAWAAKAVSLVALTVPPAWLTRQMLSLPWLKKEYARMPEMPGPLEEIPPTDGSVELRTRLRYDGGTPASGVDSKPWMSVDAPLTNTSSNRNPAVCSDVINQFAVRVNTRYKANQQGKGETYCNIFVWDVTKAMGAEIPHWVNRDGRSVATGEGSELDANGIVKWLQQHGELHGWRSASARETQEAANRGLPAVAVRENPGEIGHVAVVRPGEYSEEQGPWSAQAGTTNFNEDSLIKGFVTLDRVEYYIHD